MPYWTYQCPKCRAVASVQSDDGLEPPWACVCGWTRPLGSGAPPLPFDAPPLVVLSGTARIKAMSRACNHVRRGERYDRQVVLVVHAPEGEERACRYLVCAACADVIDRLVRHVASESFR